MENQHLSNKVSSVSARLLAHHLVQQGISMPKLLEGSSYSSPEDFERQTDLISSSDYCTLVRNALALTENPALGLTRAMQVFLSDYDAYGYAIMSSKNLGEAAKIGSEFWVLSGSLLDISSHVEDDIAIFEFTPRTPLNDVLPYIAEESMSVIYQLCRFLIGDQFKAQQVNFSYPEPAYSEKYKDVFQCQLSFNADRNSIDVPVAVLEEPLKMSSPQVAKLCMLQCDALIKQLTTYDEFVESIRRLLISAKPNFPNIEETASKLNMSERTLRRRLKQHNTTYRDLLDEIRLELAQQYLRDTHLSIDQIASLVGFEETTSFRKAYKGWTGISASDYRAQLSQ
ncbi:MAG: AraC family transcriptional regulator [Pseudomonadales bacterium]|nr:AraC family transcriptional regulator [Pseudomonadales bacterium]